MGETADFWCFQINWGFPPILALQHRPLHQPALCVSCSMTGASQGVYKNLHLHWYLLTILAGVWIVHRYVWTDKAVLTAFFNYNSTLSTFGQLIVTSIELSFYQRLLCGGCAECFCICPPRNRVASKSKTQPDNLSLICPSCPLCLKPGPCYGNLHNSGQFSSDNFICCRWQKGCNFKQVDK